jgi:hypothetical protein
MTSNDLVSIVDQHGIVKAEPVDTSCNLLD